MTRPRVTWRWNAFPSINVLGFAFCRYRMPRRFLMRLAVANDVLPWGRRA